MAAFTPTPGLAFVEIGLPSSSGGTDTAIFRLDQLQHLRSEVEKRNNGYATSTHVFQTNNRSYLDQTLVPILQSSPLPLIRTRVGVRNGPQFVYRAWQNEVVLRYSVKPAVGATGGLIIVLKTADSLYTLNSVRTTAHKGTVSQIIESIWKSHSNESFLIEPTAGKRVFYQSKTASIKYLALWLIPRALNANGQSDFRFYIKDGRFVCKTVNYLANEPWFLTAGGTPGFNNISVDDHSVEYSQAGGSLHYTASFDPISGKSLPLFSKDSGVAKLASAKAGVVNLTQTRSHLGPNLQEDEEAVNQYQFASAASRARQLSFTLANNQMIELGDLVQVDLTGAGAKRSAWSGIWVVEKHYRLIEQGSSTSSIQLARAHLNISQNKEVFQQDQNAGTSDLRSPISDGRISGKTITVSNPT